jgi:hypothetical protein
VEDMNTFLSYLVVFAIAALIVLPSLVGHARNRAIDRQLRRAAGRRAPRTAAIRSPGHRPERRPLAPRSAG